MSKYLLINPDVLYTLYSHKNVDEYYPFNFYPEIDSIETEIFYDILNSITDKILSNLNMYIFKQWALTRNKIESEMSTPLKRRNDILQLTFSNDICVTKDEFNNKLNEFIQGDQILSLYVMNQMLKFLYPC